MNTSLPKPSTCQCQPLVHARGSAKIFTVLALGLAGAALDVRAQMQVDNFDDGDDAGWTRYDPIGTSLGAAQNTWSFPSGTYRLQANSTPNPAAGPGRVGSFRQDTTYSDFHITADLVRWNGARTNAYGLIARVQPAVGLGMTSGYLFGYVSGDNYVALVRLDNERTRAISGAPIFPTTLDTNQTYRFTFTGRGTQLTGRVFSANDLKNPLAVVQATDGTYGGGTAGLLAFGVNAGALEPVDVTFDNYAATDRDLPRLSFSLSFFNELTVSWPAFEGAGFVLQGARDPGPDGPWEDITSNISQSGDFFLYEPGFPEGIRFFRLKKP